MPQFDLLTFNSQSSTFIGLICLFYAINLMYFIIPYSISEKYRTKIVVKTNEYLFIIKNICFNYLWLVKYRYDNSLKTIKN